MEYSILCVRGEHNKEYCDNLSMLRVLWMRSYCDHLFSDFLCYLSTIIFNMCIKNGKLLPQFKVNLYFYHFNKSALPCEYFINDYCYITIIVYIVGILYKDAVKFLFLDLKSEFIQFTKKKCMKFKILICIVNKYHC